MRVFLRIRFPGIRFWPFLFLLAFIVIGVVGEASDQPSSHPQARATPLFHTDNDDEQCHIPADVTPTRYLRGAWMATVTNTDWPSRSGLTADQQRQEFLHWLDVIQQAHFNAIFVQVRPMGDVFYPSELNPWSAYLTGVQGQDPGYDPLAFMVGEAHKRNIELHAWFNPYRVSLEGDLSKLAVNNPARLHPDWVVTYGGKLYYNPGLPEVRQLLVQSVLEVVWKYDIDGVHLDDYFYPYPVAGQDFPDDVTYQQYGAATFAQKADWRRDNVNRQIKDLAQAIKQQKPWVQFGVSPFGIWRNQQSDPAGSDTQGFEGYSGLYADVRTWVKQNWLDYVAPQLYWSIDYALADYRKLLPWWADVVKGTHVVLYIGQAAYRVGSQDTGWSDPQELSRQLQLNLEYTAVKGSLFFSIHFLESNQLDWRDTLVNTLYRYPAIVPMALSVPRPAPPAPLLAPLQRSASGITLRWFDKPTQTEQQIVSYAIYRFPGDNGNHTACDFEQPQFLIATLHKQVEGQQSFVDTTVEPGQNYTYYVAAFDRFRSGTPMAGSQGSSFTSSDYQ